MDRKDMTPVAASPETMWRLSADRKTVRFALPPVPLVEGAEPIRVYLDFDAESVDAAIERLTVLRGQMLPPLPAPGKRN
jgi:hypothetical protein